jgi:hypothetical protein
MGTNVSSWVQLDHSHSGDVFIRPAVGDLRLTVALEGVVVELVPLAPGSLDTNGMEHG